jgi:hypothetical protein
VLARTEPWKSIWIAGKTESSVFGKPSSELTEEQKAIVLWSRMYDSVYENPKCPPDFIINDDDTLDGWLITQNRKRESEVKGAYGEQHLGKVGKDGAEVYIPVQSAKDAQRGEEMNDARARIIKRQRMAAVKSKGSIKEQYMPDSQITMKAQARKQFSDHVKGNK